MRISIVAIGAGRQGLEQQLAKKWFSKLPYRGQLIECISKMPLGKRRIDNEGERLLAAMPEGAVIVAMDGRGRETSSEDLAKFIQKYRDAGERDAVFAIGGADGHSNTMLKRADFTMAFGAQTWPHMLFRAMLAEQLFRAEMILAGHPYHHT